MSKRQRSPLDGVVACCSNIQDKDTVHDYIEKLGGQYTRIFSKANTHLICEQAHGDKYTTALQLGIPVLRTSWVGACWDSQSLADEVGHELASAEENTPVSLHESLQRALAVEPSALFGGIKLFVLSNEKEFANFKDLTGLVRRHMGLILWELVPEITHIVTADQVPDQSPAPDAVVVTPRWVIDSCTAHELQPTAAYTPEAPEIASRIFQNCFIHTDDDDLRRKILQHGGNQRLKATQYSTTPKHDGTLVRKLWIKACIDYGSLIDPNSMSDLFLHAFTLHPLPKPLHISLSGFIGLERIGLRHLIAELGGHYDDAMRTSTDVLVTKVKSGNKFERAVEWNIQVEERAWLLEAARGNMAVKESQVE